MGQGHVARKQWIGRVSLHAPLSCNVGDMGKGHGPLPLCWYGLLGKPNLSTPHWSSMVDIGEFSLPYLFHFIFYILGLCFIYLVVSLMIVCMFLWM